MVDTKKIPDVGYRINVDGIEYLINAVWNKSKKVWITDSDVIGLHIEVDTIEEFGKLMEDTAEELIRKNHRLQT